MMIEDERRGGRYIDTLDGLFESGESWSGLLGGR